MNSFTYLCPTKVYFGEGAAAKALPVELARQGGTVLLAYGGGSVIDCCKIVAAQAVTGRDIWEMEFTDHQFPTEFLPMGAVVTAAGTGAEMNNGAVITNEKTHQKTGVWGAQAAFAVLDPGYTMTLPEKQVISGAFDTLSHCMETYFGSPRDGTLSDEIGEAVMRSVIHNMRALKADLYDKKARSELMWASSMGDNAAQFARFAEEVWRIPAKGKTQEELAAAGVESLAGFIREMGLPTTLREMGITDKAVLKQTADSCALTAGCCKKLSRAELLDILEECF